MLPWIRPLTLPLAWAHKWFQGTRRTRQWRRLQLEMLEERLTLTVDTTAPLVSLTAPNDNQFVLTSTPTLSATASDEEAASHLSARLSIEELGPSTAGSGR